MRKHVDSEGVVRSMTITRSEWRRRGRARRTVDRRRRTYVWIQCEQLGRVQVRARIVPDRSPEARRAVGA